jgi:hypothetical protein
MPFQNKSVHPNNERDPTRGSRPASRSRLNAIVIASLVLLIVTGGIVARFGTASPAAFSLHNLWVNLENGRRALDETRRKWDQERRDWEERRRAHEQAQDTKTQPLTPSK